MHPPVGIGLPRTAINEMAIFHKAEIDDSKRRKQSFKSVLKVLPSLLTKYGRDQVQSPRYIGLPWPGRSLPKRALSNPRPVEDGELVRWPKVLRNCWRGSRQVLSEICGNRAIGTRVRC